MVARPPAVALVCQYKSLVSVGVEPHASHGLSSNSAHSVLQCLEVSFEARKLETIVQSTLESISPHWYGVPL